MDCGVGGDVGLCELPSAYSAVSDELRQLESVIRFTTATQSVPLVPPPRAHASSQETVGWPTVRSAPLLSNPTVCGGTVAS